MANLLLSLSLADLQKNSWLLSQLEEDGVLTLPEARLLIEDAMQASHRVRQGQNRHTEDTSVVDTCPACNGEMTRYSRLDNEHGDVVIIAQCDGHNAGHDGGCRYSYIVRGAA